MEGTLLTLEYLDEKLTTQQAEYEEIIHLTGGGKIGITAGAYQYRKEDQGLMIFNADLYRDGELREDVRLFLPWHMVQFIQYPQITPRKRKTDPGEDVQV